MSGSCGCVSAISEPTCTWSGQLPMKFHRNPAYSCKVFLGGVPWDITEGTLRDKFSGSLFFPWFVISNSIKIKYEHLLSGG